jgi:hypothetical protein
MRLMCKLCGAPVTEESFKKENCIYCNTPIDKEAVNLFLKTNEYLEDYNSEIRSKIRTITPLSPEEDNKFKELLKYERINPNDLDDLYILYSVFKGAPTISYETFAEFVKVFVGKTMNLVAKDINPNLTNVYTKVFIKALDQGKLGSTIEHHIYNIDNNQIEKLYKGDLNAFITLVHEMYHGVHDISIKSGKTNSIFMQIIKEQIIRSDYNKKHNDDDFYYKKNYKSISYEVYAQQAAVNMLEFTLNAFNLHARDEDIDFLRNQYDRDLSNQNRVIMIDGKEEIMTVDEIFKDVVKSHPEVLNDFPQLKLEYVIENNEVREKTKDELKATLEGLTDEDAIIYIKDKINKRNLSQ